MYLRRPALLPAIACLLLNVLSCNGAWLLSAQARKCCASGDCSPANHDSCCRTSPAGSVQTLEAHSSPTVPAPAIIPLIVNAAPLHLVPATRPHDIEAGLSGTPPPGDLPGCPLPLRV
jgi:hypothetical protein